MLNRLLYEGKSRLPQNATSDLIRRDPRFGLKPIWRQAPFSALKVGSRHLVKFGSELWVFPLQKSPKELLPPSKECSNALYHPGAPRPKQRPIFSNVRVFIRSWKSIQSRIGKSFLHPTRAGSTFLRSCKKTRRTSLRLAYPSRMTCWPSNGPWYLGPGLPFHLYCLSPSNKQPPCICLPSADYMSRWLPDYATVVFV